MLTEAVGNPALDPGELARRLGIMPPTPEQAAVIEAPLEPAVVVAGAGSGKSETMAGRVVWLVANGLARPEQILGLTFTRKAAAELAERVRRRLTGLVEAGLVEPELLDSEPTVSTYHAYAARLVADHALREGLEPTMRLVTPAVAWQLAARVVGQYEGPMDKVDLGPVSVTKAVLDLAGEMAEHLCGADDVREVGGWLRERLAGLSGRIIKDQRTPAETQDIREQLLPMVEAYERLKRSREVIDYGDQMALAARIATRHPEVGMSERTRFAVVLLDEYQDTSHAQLVLLRALYHGGHPVTAVGDPCQSIYGWRGASAGNLSRFPRDFPTAARDPAPVRQLSMSFRNGEHVLGVAAEIQRPLRAEARQVPVLVPGDNRVGRGRVVCAFHETAEDEAGWIAERVATLLRWEGAPDGLPWTDGERGRGERDSRGEAVQPKDVAILARKRSQFPALRRALAAQGIPVEVVGLGGLLTVPEVADIVATLRTLYDPTAGDALVRLLAGPRWRIGPADLKVLGDLARELNREMRSGKRAEDPLEQVVLDLAEERGSLIDALDELPELFDRRPEWLEGFSPAARERLPRLALELRLLRAHAGQPLPELISEVERRLGLDVEVAARGGAVGGPLAARADLDAFLDAAARFAGDAEDPTLGAFLAYLKAAEAEEFGLEAGRVGDTNSVKLMTVHASKGLEWPVVIVPGLSQVRTQKGEIARGSVFPATPVTNSRWTKNPRKLPYPLRGDRADLPALAGLEKDVLADFDQRCRERDLMEERRLAYVAVTRAHYLLVASGYRWGTSSKPLEPSDFLMEIRRAGARIDLWHDSGDDEDEQNPLLAEPPRKEWPVISVADGVDDGARLVEEALVEEALAEEVPAREPATDEAADLRARGLRERDRERMRSWARDTELLLRERETNRRRTGMVVELPARLTVSSLVTLAADPAAFARQVRRPVPRKPAPLARRGTTFHRWLETRWGQQRLIDDFDLPGAADELSDADIQLTELQERFEESEWAGREPLDLEVPFETMIADRLLRGRMDAVFREGDGFVVVDWKTGERPQGRAAENASVQLAAYRMAWAALAGAPLEKVGAAFHYVRSNETTRPVDLLDADGLAALIRRVPEVD
ncbi:ATP-dependent DNA helicase [Sphaerimonospora thailandensis]|uniref:DNA 3'-5' helicase n=2 Tax=Sphaerimonospora thailandensis TaxID=795644 RepID=A0A8J3RDV5_9ACTN|nr:ATP-dependent DNA helicase [Sphaerimonospora thailandensis]